MAEITSVQNPRVRAAVRLRDRRHRDKQGQIVIDGVREVARALEAGVRFAEVFFCEQLLLGQEAAELAQRLSTAPGDVHQTTPVVFEKLTFGHRAEGVLAVAETPQPRLADIELSRVPMVAVLEGVEKPGNVGAVLRSADAAGLDAVVMADPGTDLFNPNAIRASIGTIFSMPVAAVTPKEALDWLRAAGMRIVAARVDGATPYTRIDFRQPTAIVLGSEAEGLSDVWYADDVAPISLPMRGTADSLNVSTTAAVLFYEALRQREA